jgi:hypothetical protein
MFAKDSLINLRVLKQPRASCGLTKTKRPLPLDELRELAAAKKQRHDDNSSNSYKKKKTVEFQMTRNIVYDIDAHDNAKSLWLSDQETDRVRKGNLESIAAFRAGTMNYNVDCLRGLELHANRELLQKKIQNCANFRLVVLEQQQLLVNLMGRAPEAVLAKMSGLLSEEDAQDAVEAAKIDAQEAALIHAEEFRNLPAIRNKAPFSPPVVEVVFTKLTTGTAGQDDDDQRSVAAVSVAASESDADYL